MATFAATANAQKAVNERAAQSPKVSKANIASPTNITVSTDTARTLADKYIVIQNAGDKFCAGPKWGWAQSVSNMLDSTPDKSNRTATCEELGKRIGEVLRGKAFSITWVKQHVSAYKKFDGGIHTLEDARAFLSAVNGNTARDAAPAKPEQTDGQDSEPDTDEGKASGFAAKIAALVARAVKAGISREYIIIAVEVGLSE